ncbi:hypothetical protein [Arthrobacter subterraneus]|uniref:hypothetical protein n=1 Tax=Arthrobacter subterraneus TaxID=335973 RepID=UPI00381D389F
MPAGKSFVAAARLFLLGAGSALTWAALSASPALADDGGLLPDIGEVTSAGIAADPVSEEPVPAPVTGLDPVVELSPVTGLVPVAPLEDPAPVGLIPAPEPVAEVIEHVVAPVQQVAAPVTGVVPAVEQLVAPVVEPAVALIEPVTAIVEPVVQVAEEALPVPLTVLPVPDEPVSAPIPVDGTLDVVVAPQAADRAGGEGAVDESPVDESPAPASESGVASARFLPGEGSSPQQSTQSFNSSAAAHEVPRGEPTDALADASPSGSSRLGVTVAPSVGASGSGGAIGLAIPPPSWSVLPTWFVLAGQQVPGGLPSGPSYDPGSTPD